jgi:hypothetical protein
VNNAKNVTTAALREILTAEITKGFAEDAKGFYDLKIW